VLAITTALGRWEEFRLHTRAALEQKGLTEEEVREVLIQSAIYAGVPAANTAFAITEEIITAMRPE
jgi:alkylhydroperoxidase/carboxymuconolactone decarboxylase family protein YurZ